jgi:hypothetical protein
LNASGDFFFPIESIDISATQMNGFVFNELPPAVISNCRLLGCFVPGKNGKIASGAHADDAPGTYLFNKKPMSGTQGECVLGLFVVKVRASKRRWPHFMVMCK